MRRSEGDGQWPLRIAGLWPRRLFIAVDLPGPVPSRQSRGRPGPPGTWATTRYFTIGRPIVENILATYLISDRCW